ncbi:MAG: transcriptional repressor [Pleurocapsa sp. SU_196_0]|nr:transcriptional repressor [Pleurocapsa sp. SU_196_0]
MRRTTQRDAIRRVIEQQARPLSPHEVLLEARRIEPGIGLATVYRTLHTLLEEGSVRGINTSTTTRFERAGLAPHAHFHCRACERLYDVPITREREQLPVPNGFRLETQEVVLFGLCSSCATEGG